MRIYILVLCAMLMGAVGSDAFEFKWPGGGKAQATKNADEFFRQARSAYGSADYSKVIELTTKAIKEDKTHAKSFSLRGKAKKDMGDVDGAFKDLNSAIALDSKLGEAYFVRGQANEIMGEMDKAKADYKKGCDAGYRSACR